MKALCDRRMCEHLNHCVIACANTSTRGNFISTSFLLLVVCATVVDVYEVPGTRGARTGSTCTGCKILYLSSYVVVRDCLTCTWNLQLYYGTGAGNICTL